MIDQDRLERLLKYTEEFPASQIVVEFAAKSGPRFEMQSGELEDILRAVLFEVPALRKAFDTARETLQEQIAGETLSFERPKWEYWETPFNLAMNYISHFNKKGAEGWELVHCDFGKGKALFKRAK